MEDCLTFGPDFPVTAFHFLLILWTIWEQAADKPSHSWAPQCMFPKKDALLHKPGAVIEIQNRPWYGPAIYPQRRPPNRPSDTCSLIPWVAASSKEPEKLHVPSQVLGVSLREGLLCTHRVNVSGEVYYQMPLNSLLGQHLPRSTAHSFLRATEDMILKSTAAAREV